MVNYTLYKLYNFSYHLNLSRFLPDYISEIDFNAICKGGAHVDVLEKLLQENLIPRQRYVHFKIQNRQDAEDIIQDVCLTATLKFDTLHSPAAFKAWLIGIARHKCMDYYRLKATEPDISLDALSESALRVEVGIGSNTAHSIVCETMESLGDKERQILYLFFFRNLSQEDIARQLDIPLGTVKKPSALRKKSISFHVFPRNHSDV